MDMIRYFKDGVFTNVTEESFHGYSNKLRKVFLIILITE